MKYIGLIILLSGFLSVGGAEKTVNLWPVYYAANDYVSICWPIFDSDGSGMAVRPFFSVRNSEYSVLWPLSGWNVKRKDGWVLNSFWRRNSFMFFPLFYYEKDGGNRILYVMPFYSESPAGKLAEYGMPPFFYHTIDKRSWALPLYLYRKTSENSWKLTTPVSHLVKKVDHEKKPVYSGVILNSYFDQNSDIYGIVPFFHYDKYFQYYLLYWNNAGDASRGIFPIVYWSKDFKMAAPFWMTERNYGLFPVFWKLEQLYLLPPLYYNHEPKFFGLFPIFNQNIQQNSGWLLPLYVYSWSDYKKQLNIMMLCNYSREKNAEFIPFGNFEKSNDFYFCYYKNYEKSYRAKYPVNLFFSQGSLLKNFMQNGDFAGISQTKKNLQTMLKVLGAQVQLPDNVDDFSRFWSELEAFCGYYNQEDSFGILPFYYDFKSNYEEQKYYFWPFYREQRKSYSGLKIPANICVTSEYNQSFAWFYNQNHYEYMEWDFKSAMMRSAFSRLCHAIVNLNMERMVDLQRIENPKLAAKTPDAVKKFQQISNNLGIELEVPASVEAGERQIAELLEKYTLKKQANKYSILLFSKADGYNIQRSSLFPFYYYKQDENLSNSLLSSVVLNGDRKIVEDERKTHLNILGLYDFYRNEYKIPEQDYTDLLTYLNAYNHELANYGTSNSAAVSELREKIARRFKLLSIKAKIPETQLEIYTLKNELLKDKFIWDYSEDINLYPLFYSTYQKKYTKWNLFPLAAYENLEKRHSSFNLMLNILFSYDSQQKFAERKIYYSPHKIPDEFQKTADFIEAESNTDLIFPPLLSWFNYGDFSIRKADKKFTVAGGGMNFLIGLYNYRYLGDNYKFNLLGILSRGYYTEDAEEFKILELLYAYSRDKNEKSWTFFPFINYRTDEKSSQFSFLWRFLNFERNEKSELSGHICFIPFGKN